MTTPGSAHLTNEQFTDLLIGGDATSEPMAHLAHCAACQAEQRLFLASVSDFNNASLAWMGSKATSRPAVTHTPSGLRSAWVSASLAFATAALLAVAIPVWTHSHRAPSTGNSAVAFTSPDSASEIAQDNKLMQSVSIALATEDESPLREYHLSAKPNTGSKDMIKLRKR